jgi:ComEC/Rec2-related protein
MQRPLAPVALAYVAGVLWGWWSSRGQVGLQVPLEWLFTAACVALGGTLANDRAARLLLWPLLFFTGWANLALRTAVLSPHDLRVLVRQQSALAGGTHRSERAERGEAFLVSVRGVLRETPTHRLYENFRGETQLRSQAFVRLEAVRFDVAPWQPAFGEIVVSTPELLPERFFAGQPVEVSGVLRRPKTAAAENLFDYCAYLETKGIHYQLETGSTEDWRVNERLDAPTHPPLADRFAKWAQATLARGLPEEDEPLRLTWAMALGWKTALTDEVSEAFMRSGTMHVFAISGLHIALIAGILMSLLRVVQVPRTVCGLIAVPAIWFYTVATGWQASAIRSTVMMTVIIGGWMLKRPSDLLNSLAAAGLIILTWDPLQLFQAGFQLSFFVVLSLALLMPPFEKLRQRVLKTDPFLPPELRPRWRQWLDTPLYWLSTSAATSLAAWLGSLPIVAFYFHLLTPITLLANLVVVPLSGFALMSNLGSLLCGDWLPWLTELFNHSGWFWMGLMVRLSQWFTRWPGAFFYVPPPSVWAFGFYYLSLMALLTGWLFQARRRVWCAAGLAVPALVMSWHWWVERDTVEISLLPLNGGEAIFVDAPGRAEDWLIDCGNTNSTALVVKPFLHGQGVNRLAHLVVTHGDLRNVGGAREVVDEFHVGEVFTNAVPFRSAAYRQLVRGLAGSGARRRQLSRGEKLPPWTVLHPDASDRFSQADDNTLVQLGQWHGHRVLFLSDLGPDGQQMLLRRGYDLRADIVVSGLPSEGEPLREEVLEAIRPRLIILTDAETPVREKAGPSLRARLAGRGVPVFYTSDEGALKLLSRPDGWALRTHGGRVLHRSKNAPAAPIP